MDVTAVVVREGEWLAVSVPEVDGAFTQARTVEEVPAQVADAVGVLLDVPADSVRVRVTGP